MASGDLTIPVLACDGHFMEIRASNLTLKQV